MGAGNSVEIPGGGSEGYHVLRVSMNESNSISWSKQPERKNFVLL